MTESIINEPDRVVLTGEWASEVLYDVTYSGTENLEKFNEQFETVHGDFPANPDEDYYQGMLFMSLIRRKSDGRLFGYERWEMLAKYDDAPQAEPNGWDYGFETDDDVYVWLPVEPFTITGYKIS